MGRKSKEQLAKEAAERESVVTNEPGPDAVGEDSGTDGGPPRIAPGEFFDPADESIDRGTEGVQDGMQDAPDASEERDPIDDRPTLSRDDGPVGHERQGVNAERPDQPQVNAIRPEVRVRAARAKAKVRAEDLLNSGLDTAGMTLPEPGTAVPQAEVSADPKSSKPAGRRFKVVRGVVGSFGVSDELIPQANFNLDDAGMQRLLDAAVVMEVD